MKIEIGQVLGGSYRVIRRIGTGGMSEVYEVEHRQLGVHYALKTFTLSHGSVELLKKRFLAEGKVLSRLKHPNIIHVHDLDFDVVTGTPYFVMDLVLDKDGEPRTFSTVNPQEMEDGRVEKWFLQLCKALDYIHSKGIVHRDIKPGNILINENGDALLSDFGVSRYIDEELKRQLSLTCKINENGMRKSDTMCIVMGSEGFRAPEVEHGGLAIPASDAYSLGLVFFKLLTGMEYIRRRGMLRMLDPIDPKWRRTVGLLLNEMWEERPIPLTPLAEQLDVKSTVAGKKPESKYHSWVRALKDPQLEPRMRRMRKWLQQNLNLEQDSKILSAFNFLTGVSRVLARLYMVIWRRVSPAFVFLLGARSEWNVANYGSTLWTPLLCRCLYRGGMFLCICLVPRVQRWIEANVDGGKGWSVFLTCGAIVVVVGILRISYEITIVMFARHAEAIKSRELLGRMAGFLFARNREPVKLSRTTQMKCDACGRDFVLEGELEDGLRVECPWCGAITTFGN